MTNTDGWAAAGWLSRLIPPHIFSLRFRYGLAMASVALVDVAMNSVYFILAHRPEQMVIVVPESFMILGALNVLVALRIYRPIQKFIVDGTNPVEAREALARLPRRSSIWIAVLTPGYCTLLFLSGTFTPDPALLEGITAWNLALALVWFGFVYTVYYSFFAYFLIDNVAMSQRATLFRDHSLEIRPRRHLFRNKLVYAFGVVALVPASHLIMDLLVFRDLRIAQGFDVIGTVLLDLFATVVVLCLAVILVVRGMLRPVRELTATVVDIDKGVLDRRAAIISHDEFGVLMAAVNRMMDGMRERAFIRETFGHYLPEAVAADIIAGEAPVQPKIETATILFADIEDFTGLAERLSPTELVEVLNEYFSAVIEPVQRHNGVVNQFQGDGMLVTFNIPVRDPRHADNALAAAIEMADIVNNRCFGGIRLRTRIGINTGLVFAGNVGSGDRFNYTVHGDAVNIASRLENLNKELGTRLLVSSATYDLLTDKHPLSKNRVVTVKGKDRPISVYSPQEECVPPDAPAAVSSS
ncbi:adenylate/guanylate cyclase domain-containing protein [Pseudomonadota bacterium]